ncbi:TfoX/Sxy family protein [Luteimonas sp. 8-5]|uniref:TfoX/Sxy family protein n=1 Tax=Luteimonas sp. 8-5 TaxID=3039387 RepID=UPI00243736F9|nr:TfoX/Sxy family protein [Luteimonas sp. 8-5]MDG6349151.1 TfoX/Sxy family protein [Luteimonas sp. 8-5]
MASDPGFVEYVVEQIGLGDELVHKRLFGEWGLWLDGRIVALVCDDQLLLKPTPAGRALLGGDPPGVEPYPEAKPWFLVEDLDDSEALRKLLRTTFDALPTPKRKRK